MDKKDRKQVADLTEKYANLQLESREIRKKINEVFEKYNDKEINPVRVVCDVDYVEAPIRKLWFTVADIPPGFNNNKSMSMILLSLVRDEWLEYFCTVRSMIHEYYRHFEPFENCIVTIRFHERYAYLRDVDNLMVTVIHNALVRNGIILSDDSSRLRYCYICGLETKKEEQKTEITIIENSNNLKLSNDCNKCELYKITKKV